MILIKGLQRENVGKHACEMILLILMMTRKTAGEKRELLKRKFLQVNFENRELNPDNKIHLRKES